MFAIKVLTKSQIIYPNIWFIEGLKRCVAFKELLKTGTWMSPF